MRDLKQVDFSQLSNETSSDYDEELKRKRERERKYEELKKQAKQEAEREEAEKKAQSPYEQLKRQAKQEAMAADSAKVDSAYINSFLNDASNFLTSSKSSLDNTSWASAMDIGARERREASSRDLSYRADLISYYLDHNGAGVDKSTAEELRSYLDAYRTDAFNLSEAHKSYNQFYSQWATEDDYNTSVRMGGYSKKYDGMTSDEIDQVLGTLDDGEEREWLTAHRSSVRYDEMLKYDTESATKQVNDLKDILDQMEAIKGRIQIAQNMPTYTPGYSSSKSVIAGYEAELAKLEQKYGSYESIKAQYNQKSAYLSNAKRIQEGVELASVADGNSENYDPGFAFESKYTPNDDWYDSLEFSDVLYDEANGVKRATPVPKSWADKITAAKQMTEEELAIFNYWYNNEGWDKAEKYLDSIMDELNLRVAKNRFADMKGNTALELLFSLEAGYDQFLSGAQNLFNTEDSYIPVSSTQILSGMVRKDLGDNGPKLPEWLGGSSLGQVGYDFVTTSANMAPSILTSAALSMVNPTLGAVAGNTLMGASAAGNAYAEKINLGYSKDEARSYGLMIGASEATLQYLLGGIGKLGGNGLSKVAINNLDKVDNILARVAKSTGGKIFLNGVSEGFEEGLQAILEPYLWQAVSGEEGSVDWEETLYSSLLGFITGGVFESPGAIVQSAGQNIGYYKTGADIRSAGGTDALMALANEVAGVAPANMQNAIQKQSSKVDKKATSRRVGKLYDTVQSATSQADISQSLQTKGFSKETANDIAAAVIASNNGRDLSSSQRKLLKLVEKNSVAREAIASAMSSPQSSVGQKLREFQSGVARGNVTEAASAQLGKGGNITEGNLTTAAETAAEGRYEVAEDGKTIDGNGNVISITGISSIEKGRMVLQTEDGKTVDAGEVSYGSQDEALVYEAVANLEGIIDGETATKLAKHLLKLGNASSNVYVNGIVQAYTYGYYGYGREAMNGKNTLSATLSEEQRNVAYGLAEQYRAAKTEVDQKAAPGKKRIAGEVADKKRSVAPDGTEYKKVRFEGEVKKWGKKQKAEVEFIDFIAANFSGNTVHVYESYKNAKGQYVYRDSSGKIHPAPNGMYIDSTGDIYLDLNAGNHGEGLVMNTFAHELYHHIERESPQKARKLAEFLVQELGYENVEIAVQRQIDKAKRAGHGIEYLMKENGISRTAAERLLYDRAFSDFVADSLETMFTEGNVVEALQKLKSQDVGLFNMIKSFIDKWVKRIRQFYRSHSTISIEGDIVSHLKKFEQIQQMFAEALVDAGENFQAAEVQKNTTVGGGIQHSLRAFVKDGKRFVEIDQEQDRFDGHPVEEYPRIAKDIINEKFNGKVIGLDNKMFVNGASRDEFANPSKRIPDDLYELKMRTAGELDNLLDAGIPLPNENDGKDGHVHPDAIDFSYFKTLFKIGNRYFEAVINIKNIKRGKLFKDVTKIEDVTQDIMSSYGQSPASQFLRTSSMDRITELEEVVKSKSLEDMEVEVDTKTESVAPAPLYSERTWTESDYVQEREKAAEEIAKAIGVSKKKAKAYIDSVNGIAKMIAEDRVRLDYFSSPNRSSFIGNVEYGGSFDFSTLCKKRRLLTGTFTAIQKALPNTALTADEILDIRNRMKEAGLEVSCGLCYVEGSRANMGQFAKEFLKLYKQYYPDAWQPNMADVNTPDGIEWVRINHPECYEQYEYFWNHYGTLKPGDKNLFASQQKPKLYQLHTEYKGEILQKFKNDDNVEEKNLNGGIRLQSFSDFEIVHLIDTMQIIMDMSRVGLAGQAYTKVPDFAWALGDTGLKINLSLIAKGVDGNGKLIFDDVEGMPIQEAVALRNRYSQNVGTILVAFNDEQLLAAMADERVDYIIPFHRSQWKKSQYSAMGLPAKTKDYTFMQNEKFIKPQYHEYRGRMVRDKATNYMPNEYWDFSKSGKENAEAYLEMCARNNKRPKFYKLLQNNGDGSYSLKADGSTDGYWKLLIDFKMYDNEGNGSPQQPVKPEFNMDEATRMLNDYQGGHSNFPVAQGIVDDFVAEYKESHKGAKFSDRDYTYEALTRKPDMVVTTVGKNVPKNRADVAAEAKRNAAKVGRFDPQTGSVSVHVDDINTDVILSTKGLRHGLRRSQDPLNVPNYVVTVKAGEILKNSIRVNEITPSDDNAGSSYVLMGAAKDANGTYVVRFVVNHYDNSIASMDVLYALNAKKELAATKSPRLTAEPLSVTSSTISIAELLDLVNEYFPDILPEDVLKHYGYDARPEGDLGEDALYSDRDTESVSNRSLLANAFEGAAKTDMEKQKIQEYREKIDLMNGQEQKLRKLNQQIKELSFAKGKRDTAKIRDLRDEATKTANRISIYDKQLLRLESSKPLQDVLEREKKKAYQRAEKKGKEALAAYRQKAEAKQQEIIERYQESRKKGAEGRKKTALRHKIRTFKDKLVKSLEHPTDRVYIPAGLINAMVDVCNLIDTDTDLYKKDGSINKAQEQRNLTKEKLQNLKDEYERLKDNPDPLYKGEFDEMVYSYLTELRENAKGKSINEMSLDELSEMYEILKGIEETLQDARKLIGWGEAEDVYEAADAIISEQGAISERRKEGKRSAAQKAKDATLDLSLSPVRNVERMSGYNQDSSFLKLFKKFEQGVRKKNKFTMDAYKSFGDLTSGKEYDDAVYAEFGKKYVDANGRKFSLSKMQMMQAILSMERELANGMSHVENSGFSFADLDMLRKGKLREAISEEYSHRVPAAVDMVAEFSTALKDDQWCQDYMKAARNFFNATAKDAINETMMVLKHRIVAKDKSYIPFEVDKNFVTREISAENDIQQTINAYGMLKETKKGAPQPLIVTGLNNVIDRHIDMVGNVYGLAVEVRNFNKVWNVRSMDATSGDPTVKAIIQKNWGNGGVKHIEQAVQDIQGPRHNEQSWLYRKVKSGYIGATFLLNLSVVTKQIGSLFSANSMLNWRDPGRQIGNLLWTMANSKKISAEVDKYTASAWMRRQGLSDAELHTFMTEGRKSKLGRLTSKMPSVINPAKWITAMDHAVALSLWRYAKIDTQKRTGLKGEDLLKATAEFYDEVIENTQSMTDVLHRPEIQKKNGVIAESFAMFKTDLYQMAGQLNVAAGRFAANKSKENAKILGRTVYSIAMSAIWGQLMTTVFALLRYKVNQYRDDEDKDLTVESWLKRQGYSFAGDIMGYIFPIFGSEMVGMFENIMYGESEDIVDSVAITAVNDLYDTMLTVATAIKDGEMPNPADLKKLSIKALQVFGIPANNIIRTYEAVTLHAKDLANGEFFSFEAGVDRSAGNHIHRIVEAVDAGKIDVAMGLYEEAVEETAKGMSDEELKDASSSLKTALGDHYKEGKTTRETAERILADLFGMDDNDIYWTLDKWDYAKENGSAEGYSKYGEYYAAVAGNDRATANMLYDRLIAEKVAEGYLRSEAKDSIASSFTTQVKNEYMDGEISRSKAIRLLTDNTDNGESEVKKWDFELEHGFSWSARVKGYRLGKISESELISAVMDIEGESREEAEEYIRFLDLEMANQDISITASEASSFFEYAEPAGIAIDVYLDYKNKAKDITGEGKKKRRMDVIHSLPLSSTQKDALYYAEGWAASTIHEAPWH